METITVEYVGPYDVVEVPFEGRWLTFERGVPTDVPAVLAEGGTELELVDGRQVVTVIGGLLDQPDNWQQPALKSAKASAKAADKE